jgi:signal transduction histidine kinase
MRSLRRTLAVRLSLTIFLALLLISLWAFLGTHYSLSRQLDESLESTLQLEAAMLAARIPIGVQPSSNDLDTYIRQVNRFVTVRDSSGIVRSANSPFALNVPVDRDNFAQALFGERKLTTQAWGTRRIRSLYAPAPSNSHDGAAVIQVAASLEPLVQVERRIFFLMLGTVLLGTAATIAGAGWLAGSAVAPIAAVTSQAEAITPGAVGNRITAHADVAEFKGLVGVLNRMLERLDGALQQQRRIIADLGHDLRTPLTAMHGEIEVALRSDRSSAEYRTVLESCLEEVEHLSSIGEALVLLARIETGELKPELAATDVSALAEDAASRVRSRAEGRDITVRGAPVDNAVAPADPKMISLVLDHLLYNAIQHTPAGTHIVVAVYTGDRQAIISVEDSGRGIPDDLLPHLFERLYRTDEARTRAAGAGLGLTISAAIVDAHAGSIHASRSDLGGLKVSIRLPLMNEQTVAEGMGRDHSLDSRDG